MQKYSAAVAGDARMGVVVDLDDKVVEMIVTLQAIAVLTGIEPHRLVVMTAGGVFAPGILGPDGANRQKCARSRVAVGTPPQLPRPKRPPRGAAIAFPLVGDDAAPAKGDRN